MRIKKIQEAGRVFPETFTPENSYKPVNGTQRENGIYQL